MGDWITALNHWADRMEARVKEARRIRALRSRISKEVAEEAAAQITRACQMPLIAIDGRRVLRNVDAEVSIRLRRALQSKGPSNGAAREDSHGTP